MAQIGILPITYCGHTHLLSNIINNSADAIESDGEIIVSLLRGTTSVNIKISDNGIGIEQKYLNQLTQKMQDFARGQRIVEERSRLRLTQPRIATIGGVSKGSQILYEKGSPPTADYLAAIATAGVDILYVLTGVHADPAWLADMPQRVSVDPLRFQLCLTLVAEEYRDAAIDLPRMAQSMEAVWVYNELTKRTVDPEDGDELEATLPLLRHLLRRRLNDARTLGQ